ncbi:hypothetical protein MNV_380008 [Candidatus Methanoperedens nitroreducens]|uniref:Uncharacterized protein n=1 Tax=Candidatus Methanoperedens nitratireducens TaxID=1392998 RepID=A0A284VQM7_9EURY|nr:hypothetical protein MNV_380008 [Candidatus Methanoperedens nitroreducens]
MNWRMTISARKKMSCRLRHFYHEISFSTGVITKSINAKGEIEYNVLQFPIQKLICNQ